MAGALTVATGDNFWDLAEGELSEAWGRAPTDAEVVPHWQALVEANRDRLAPPGDPDLIYPGQLFTVPGVPADPLVPPVAEAPAPPATPAPPAVPAPPATGGPESPAPPVAELARHHDRGCAPDDDPRRSAVHRGDVPACARRGAARAPAQPAAASEPDRDGDVRTAGLVAGGIALAGAVLLVDRRRRAQQRRRRPGRDVMMPPPPLRARERELRAGADVDGARLLDVALRAAAAGCGGAGLPPLRWVEVGEGAVMLSLTTALDPPPGFAPVAPDAWVTAGGPNDLEAVADHPAPPLPALVPIGTSPRGTEVLVDLEASGVATVAGPTDRALGLLRSVVASATTSPWGDQGRVLLVGAGEDMRSFPTAWVVSEFADGLREAEAYAERVAQALGALQAPSLAHARASGVDAEAWPPLVVVSAVGPTTPEDVARLQALARRAPCGVGLVTLAGPGGEVPGRGLRIWEDGWLRVDGVDMPLQPRYLDAAEARAVADLLAVAAEREDVVRPAPPEAERIRRPAPAPPPPAPTQDDRVVEVPGPAARRLDDLLVGVDVVVSVLGEVRAERRTEGGGGEPLVPSRQRALEAIAYLALRESAVDREDLEISLFPEGANSAKTIYNTVSSARSLLGEELFPPSEGGRYELSAAVVTDYGLFCELVGEADETEDATAAAGLLTEALGLVQGEPFTGVGRSYAWVGPHRGMIVAQVVDAAEELAEVRLATGDWKAAEWAARRGLRAFPADERMYRLLMRAARVAGNISGVQRVFRELCDVIADPDLGVEPEDTLHPETVDLLEQLTGSSGRQARKGA